MKSRVGVLAYGSLITDPGAELDDAEVDRVEEVKTPFSVEFARISSGRDGAPTLVPVEERGAPVQATVLVLDEGVSLSEAKDMVYRRETHSVGNKATTYEPDPTLDNQVYVCEARDLAGLDRVLYTKIATNIDDPTPERLAELAIESAKREAGADQRDGITYLLEALEEGIETPLSGAYRQAILERAGASDLTQAWRAVRKTIQ